MDNQLIAIAIDDNGNISPHAGRASQWQVYYITPDSAIHLAWTLILNDDIGSLHEWHVNGSGKSHPLHYIDIAIAGSAGEGVILRLEEKGTKLLTTSESNPQKAVTDYLKGELAPGLPHKEQDCLKN